LIDRIASEARASAALRGESQSNGAGVTRLLSVEDLVVELSSGRSIGGGRPERKRIVDGATFAIDRGETIAIVGESGCGKTTMARAITRLIRPTSGRVLLVGRDITRLDESELRPLRRDIQMVFQDAHSSLDPTMTIERAIAEPILIHKLLPRRAVSRRVNELLEMVGLDPSVGRRRPAEFSGGQRQRLAIARALAADPKLVVLDEPISGLDVSVQAQILNLLMDLRSSLGLSYLLISHNLEVVRYLSDHVAVMYLGRLVEQGSTRDVFAQPSHPYTKALLHVSPDLRQIGRAYRKRPILAGEVATVQMQLPGCRFQTRCPLAFDRCRSEPPPPRVSVGPRHTSECWRVAETHAWSP
jgi:oligopeptide/dipeptide ABC transporter ATP-binding protein